MATFDWRAVVLDADPDWPIEAYHPKAYDFRDGRRGAGPLRVRERPGEAYPWTEDE